MKASATQYRLSHRLTSRIVAPAALLLVLLVAACSGDSATGPSNPPGTYQLTTVQGKGLPYRVYSDVNYSVDVADGSIALNTDGSFVATMKSEERVENHLSVYADTANGKWALNGTTISLTSADGSRTAGTWSGRTLTLTDSSTVVPLVYVYTMR